LFIANTLCLDTRQASHERSDWPTGKFAAQFSTFLVQNSYLVLIQVIGSSVVGSNGLLRSGNKTQACIN